MRSWESFQFRKPVGKTRQKLADLLSAALPEFDVFPEDLIVQNPQYSSALSDCCSWTCWAKKKTDRDFAIHLHSWQTMGMLVKKGVVVAFEGHFEVEVYAKESPRASGSESRESSHRAASG